MRRSRQRLLLAPVLVLAGLTAPFGAAGTASAAPAPVLDLERLTAPEAEAMMAAGTLTSVQLTQAYLDRIDALNKRGPGLNAVTQLNAQALADAARLDAERAAGTVRGPVHGMPVLLKDLIDVTGMYTSNGNYSLRNSFPADDSGIAKKLKASGAVILGKLGLSEYANSFGSQPSGFSNLTGQVLNAVDADQNPSGSSSGTGAAGAAALSMLTVGTETAGSIISPSQAQGLVGLRPTVGLVPAYGIGPISSSQDTAGPMDRTVANAAYNLQAMAGRDLKNEAGYAAVFGPGWRDSITPAPDVLPDYLSALDLDFVRGKRIGYNGALTEGSPLALAVSVLRAAGAELVERPSIAVAPVPGLPAGYQQHKAINEYYANLGPDAPVKTLTEEIAANQAESAQALKFGNQNHVSAAQSDVSPGSPAEVQYRAAMPVRRAAQWAAIDAMMANETADPSDDFIALLGTVPSGSTAGTPQITVPFAYSTTARRATGFSIHGNRLSERDLIGVAYVLEQATRFAQPVSELNPSMYRCAATVPAPAYAERGACNPSYAPLFAQSGGVPDLGFALETESVQALQARMTAGTLTAETLTRAYLARIALSNADGPALQAVRSVSTTALPEAKALDRERSRTGARGPLHGIPVLVDDVFDVDKLPTTGGSIALQERRAKADSTVVARLRAAGAVVLGKTNVSELNGALDDNAPDGYSSLGGQVLLPSDTDKTPAGSSPGSPAATAAGLAAMTVGLETSLDTAELVQPAGVAGVVGLKPTVGLVSRTGVLGVARSQDSPGPVTRTVYDAALQLQVIAGKDATDPATSSAPAVPAYTAGLTPTALSGTRVAVVSSTSAAYPQAVAALAGLGAVTTVRSVGTPSPNPPGIVLRELERDLDAYLATSRGGGARSLAGIVAYNAAHPVEGLKYQQRTLLSALEVDLAVPEQAASYTADLTAGRASSRAVIDGVLGGGTADPSDDAAVAMVPNDSPLLALADRGGYPMLTVPAGFGTGGAGRNPIGVTFVGTAFSEAALLQAGYAFEQATKVRVAPSTTNPSMWRCVAGSAFFTAELCHPGDRQPSGPTTATPEAAVLATRQD